MADPVLLSVTLGGVTMAAFMVGIFAASFAVVHFNTGAMKIFWLGAVSGVWSRALDVAIGGPWWLGPAASIAVLFIASRMAGRIAVTGEPRA